MKKHIKCKAGCGCGNGYFNNFQEAKAKHDSDMWAYEMPHEYNPVEIDDATGKETSLDKNTGKPLKENTMKKSELKQLIKAIVTELHEVKAQRLSETKGLSGFKKTSDKAEHTEDIAASKSLTPNSEPKEKEEGKKLPVVKKPATPQKAGDLKEGFGDMLQTYADWSLFIKDIASVGAFIVAGLLLGYIWLSDTLKTKLRNIIKSKVGQEFDAYLENRANELKNDPAIRAALADPNHKGLHTAIKSKLNRQDMEMNKKVNSAIGYNNLVATLGKAVSKSAVPATPSTGASLKEEILGMVREALEQSRINEMPRTAGAIASKFKKEVSPGNWVVSGHPSIPDGTPTEAPKGPYVPKGIAGMGRPKKGAEPAVSGQATASVPLIVSAVMPDGKAVELNYDFINNTWPAAKKYIEQEVMSELPDALDPNVKIGQSVYDKIEAAKELEIDGKLNQSNNKITLSFDKASKQLIAK